MNKTRTNSNVKKTLVRNCEEQVKPSTKKHVVYDAGMTKAANVSCRNTDVDNELDEPVLCSSEMFTNYLSDIKKLEPPPIYGDDHIINKEQHSAKMTKKLNFHFNDKIYKNLIELNANVDLKSKKEKRQPSIIVSSKKDVEPNIEDFYEDVIEQDFPPTIPVRKPKFKPLRKVENGHIHKLVAAFESF